MEMKLFWNLLLFILLKYILWRTTLCFSYNLLECVSSTFLHLKSCSAKIFASLPSYLNDLELHPLINTIHSDVIPLHSVITERKLSTRFGSELMGNFDHSIISTFLRSNTGVGQESLADSLHFNSSQRGFVESGSGLCGGQSNSLCITLLCVMIHKVMLKY